jgi:precorrin-6A/cobalt-precorrin-6A reductase
LRLLILGGTSEASALAAALATRADIWPILSLAGRTTNPKRAPIPTRIGGFGGVDGIIDYLARERIDAIVDATHPFAEQISANAARARGELPLLVFTRPPWRRQQGDAWTEVSSIDAAVHALGLSPQTVFLTHGRLQLAPFARAPWHRYLVRSIDRPAEFDALANARLILARGPFALEDETRLIADEGVNCLVTKNSGGEATYAKIEAARRLRIPVVITNRPVAPDVETVTSLTDALAWIETHRPTP